MLSDREKDDIALTLQSWPHPAPDGPDDDDTPQWETPAEYVAVALLCLGQAGLDLGGQREVTEVLRRHLLGEW